MPRLGYLALRLVSLGIFRMYRTTGSAHTRAALPSSAGSANGGVRQSARGHHQGLLLRAGGQPHLRRDGGPLQHRHCAGAAVSGADKAKVEVAVQVATRFIIAKLRNQQFFSLSALTAAIAELVAQINNRVSRTGPCGVGKSWLFASQNSSGIGLILETNDNIVGVSYDDHVARRLTPSPAFGPQVEDVVQVNIGEQRRCHRPLPCPRIADRHDPVFQDARLQPFLDEADFARVIDSVLHEADQPSAFNTAPIARWTILSSSAVTASGRHRPSPRTRQLRRRCEARTMGVVRPRKMNSPPRQ